MRWGPDSAGPYIGPQHPKSEAWELELMVSNGFTEMESIVAATKTSAECIGVENNTGTIERSKFADMLIVDGDPMQNVRILQDLNRIKSVMKEVFRTSS